MELIRTTGSPEPCSYLPWETSSLEYRYIIDIDIEDYQALLERGWRRFGYTFFRPKCSSCSQCRSLRIHTPSFKASKSQRRSVKRNKDITVQITTPTVDSEHLDLYNAYHEDMSERRGWPASFSFREDYIESFVAGRGRFGTEFQYRRDGELLGVGLVDVLPRGLSSVYFYHHPSWRSLSPGTFSVLTEKSYAASTNRPYLYLGYWIEENQSMNYKARFKPHEILERYVEDHELPRWCSPEPEQRDQAFKV